MAGKVEGKNVILSIYNGGSYVPVGCATNCTIQVDTELIPTTTNDSGVYRTFIPRFNEWEVTCDGVTILEGASNYLPLDTLTEQIRQSGIDLQVEFTDPDGTTKTFEGFAYIYTTNIDSLYGDFSNFSFSAKGSGAFTIDTVTSPSYTGGMTIEFTGDGVTTAFSDADLINRTLHLGFVDHYEWKIVTAGSPSAEEIKFTTGSGQIDFATAPDSGVRIKLFYE